jgi:hypothetical protein
MCYFIIQTNNKQGVIMAISIWKETILEDMGLHLIKNYHPALAMLSGDMVFYFVEKASHDGKVKKLSGSTKEAAGNIMFVIEVNYETWTDYNQAQRWALLDSLLCRITFEDKNDGSRVFSIRKPLELFPEVLERHGIWNDDMGLIAESLNNDHSVETRSQLNQFDLN